MKQIQEPNQMHPGPNRTEILILVTSIGKQTSVLLNRFYSAFALSITFFEGWRKACFARCGVDPRAQAQWKRRGGREMVPYTPTLRCAGVVPWGGFWAVQCKCGQERHACMRSAAKRRRCVCVCVCVCGLYWNLFRESFSRAAKSCPRAAQECLKNMPTAAKSASRAENWLPRGRQEPPIKELPRGTESSERAAKSAPRAEANRCFIRFLKRNWVWKN